MVNDALANQRFDGVPDAVQAATEAASTITASHTASQDEGTLETYRARFESAASVEALQALTQDAAEKLTDAPASGAPRVHESTARLIVDPGHDQSIDDLALAEAALVRYADLALSLPVVQAVIDQLGLDDSPEDLLERISTEASTDTLVLTIAARDDDPERARAIAQVFGNELRQLVRDQVITADVTKATATLRDNEQLLRTLEDRLGTLLQKKGKSPEDRAKIISLTSQVSALRRDIQELRPSSRAYVRNLLDWYERPTVSTQPVRDEPSEMIIPTRDVVVAKRTIEQGTSIESEMLTVGKVYVDPITDLALTDTASALGRVAAIDILENQVITPNMLIPE